MIQSCDTKMATSDSAASEAVDQLTWLPFYRTIFNILRQLLRYYFHIIFWKLLEIIFYSYMHYLTLNNNHDFFQKVCKIEVMIII